jgi:hypothetical protein
VGAKTENLTADSRLSLERGSERLFEMHPFQAWKSECDAVHQEMDRLIRAGRPNSLEECRIREMQFAALIERRDTAARILLRSKSTNRPAESSLSGAERTTSGPVNVDGDRSRTTHHQGDDPMSSEI